MEYNTHKKYNYSAYLTCVSICADQIISQMKTNLSDGGIFVTRYISYIHPTLSYNISISIYISYIYKRLKL